MADRVRRTYTTISAGLWVTMLRALESEDPGVRADARRRLLRRGDQEGWDPAWPDAEAAERAVTRYEPPFPAG